MEHGCDGSISGKEGYISNVRGGMEAHAAHGLREAGETPTFMSEWTSRAAEALNGGTQGGVDGCAEMAECLSG